MTPRKLSVIVLDDWPNPYHLPEGLEDAGRIKTWQMALNFWARYERDALPDLVVADVYFEYDRSSPLSRVRFAEYNPLPTGLSHLKPLSVLARVGGRGIGIGIHTGNPKLWERLTHSAAMQDQCMGYLAAHELGELAAILGEKRLVAEVAETGSLDPLWRWLSEGCGDNFTAGVKIAVSNYRKRLLALASPSGGELPQVFVMPDDYAAAMCWCEERARNTENPAPLAGAGDHGLTLTYKDGTRDSILISSLFSDVDDLPTRALDARCFETGAAGVGKEWEDRDRKGLPLVGKFLSRFGTLRHAYDAAARIVENFPALPSESQEAPGRLGDYLTRKGDDPLVAGLVIVFQLGRIEKAVFDLWEKHYSSYVWDPRGCRWPEDVNTFDRSLRNALRLLLNGARSYVRSQAGDIGPEDGFTPDDVLETMVDAELPWPWEPGLELRDAEAEWCRWHFQRLADARVLKPVKPDRYVLRTQDTNVPTPPVPKTLPRRSGSIYKALGLAMKSEDSEPTPDKSDKEAGKRLTLRTWLRTSLGYGDDAHIPFRMLYNAFVRHGADEPEAQEMGEEQRAKGRQQRAEESQKRTRIKEQLGKDFLDQLEAGRAPGWLLVLCGQYAEEKLRWHDKATWPDWLLRKL